MKRNLLLLQRWSARCLSPRSMAAISTITVMAISVRDRHPAAAGVICAASPFIVRCAAGLVLLAIPPWDWREYLDWGSPGTAADRTEAARLADAATRVAVWLAGPKRSASSAEWRAHLGGESGHDPVTWQKVKDASGFVIAAIHFRLADVADAAWMPADAILKSRTLSNLLVLGISGTAVTDVDRYQGRLGVIVSAESLIGIGGLVYGLIRAGRWYRDVKPPEPKARRAKSNSGL